MEELMEELMEEIEELVEELTEELAGAIEGNRRTLVAYICSMVRCKGDVACDT